MPHYASRISHIHIMHTQVAALTDSLKRSLAEMENVRARTAREMDGAKKFAVQVGQLGGG